MSLDKNRKEKLFQNDILIPVCFFSFPSTTSSLNKISFVSQAVFLRFTSKIIFYTHWNILKRNNWLKCCKVPYEISCLCCMSYQYLFKRQKPPSLGQLWFLRGIVFTTYKIAKQSNTDHALMNKNVLLKFFVKAGHTYMFHSCFVVCPLWNGS